MRSEHSNINNNGTCTDFFNPQPVFCSEFNVGKAEFYDFSSVSYSIPLIFFMLIFLLSIISFLSMLFEGNYSSIAMQTGVPLAFSVIYYILIKYSTNKNYKRYMLSGGENSMSKNKVCFADKITASRDGHSPVDYGYDAVTAVYESKRLFLLRMNYSLYLLVSKDSFPGEAKYAFIDFMFSRCANIKRKKVKNVSGKEKLCVLFIILTSAVFLISLALYIANIFYPLPSPF